MATVTLYVEAIRHDEWIGRNCRAAKADPCNRLAVDRIEEMQVALEIADREGMWVHADAAYGGGLLLSPEGRARLDGHGLEQRERTGDPVPGRE